MPHVRDANNARQVYLAIMAHSKLCHSYSKLSQSMQHIKLRCLRCSCGQTVCVRVYVCVFVPTRRLNVFISEPKTCLVFEPLYILLK
jgi:hypothetical protein